jgi:iron complex outermembrane receptor protein
VKQGNVVRAALATAAMCAALQVGEAWAQEAAASPDAQELAAQDDIVVSGYRESLEKAIDIKRHSAGIVDAIVADDIASFPDDNLAEAMARITGVTITRSNGDEGSSVQIRGLNAKYAQTLINGMQAATGASGRQFDFSTLASELFRDVRVAKTTSADITEGGISGTIDIQTPSGFNYSKPTFVVNAMGSYNTLGQNWSPKISALAADQFLDDRLSVVVSAAYTNRTARQDSADAASWTLGNLAIPGGQTYNNVYLLWIPRAESDIRHIKRLGLTGDIAFKISDDWSIELNAVRSHEHTEYGQYEYQWYLKNAKNVGGGTKGAGTITDAVIGGVNNDTVVYANITGGGIIRSINNDQVYNQDFGLYTGILKGKVLGFDMVAKGGYSKSSTIWDVDNTNAIMTATADFSLDWRPDYHIWSPADNLANPTDPNAWTWAGSSGTVAMEAPTKTAEEYTGQIDFRHDLDNMGAWKSIVFGLRWNKLTTISTDLNATSIKLTNAQALGLYTPTPFDNFMGSFSGLPAGFPQQWMAIDFAKERALIGTAADIPTGNANASFISADYKNNYSVGENTWAGYLQARFEDDIFGGGFVGDLGVRVVSTTTDSHGYQKGAQGSAVYPFSQTGTNTSFFPSLNMRWAPAEKLYLRLSAGRSMSRPDIAYLAPNGAISLSNLTETLGNPGLKPTIANAVDLGVEWYINRDSLLSVTGFYKKYMGLVLKNSYFQDLTIDGATDTYTVTQPVNSPGPYEARGIELNYQSNWSWAPGFLKHFGHILNFTYVTSNKNQDTTPGFTHGMPGLAPYSANAVLYYQDKKLQIRAAYNYRGRYFQNASASLPIYQDSYGQLDLSASYKINENIQFRAQFMNVTDAKDYDFVVASDKVVHYGVVGRTLYFGVTGKF